MCKQYAYVFTAFPRLARRYSAEGYLDEATEAISATGVRAPSAAP